MEQEMKIKLLRNDFQKKREEAEKAAYALACELDVGDERSNAFEIYERIRTACRGPF